MSVQFYLTLYLELITTWCYLASHVTQWLSLSRLRPVKKGSGWTRSLQLFVYKSCQRLMYKICIIFLMQIYMEIITGLTAIRVVFLLSYLVSMETPADVQAIGILTVSAVFMWRGGFAFFDILVTTEYTKHHHQSQQSIQVQIWYKGQFSF